MTVTWFDRADNDVTVANTKSKYEVKSAILAKMNCDGNWSGELNFCLKIRKFNNEKLFKASIVMEKKI